MRASVRRAAAWAAAILAASPAAIRAASPAAVRAAFPAAIRAAFPAAAQKARSLRMTVGDRSVRVVVPRLFEPLLPGSVYPNRRKPLTPRATPVAIVAKDLARRAEPLLLDRGFVVAEVETIDRASVDRLLAALAPRVEGGIGEAVLLARDAGDAASHPRVRAAALFDPPSLPAPGGAALLLHRAAAGELPGAPASSAAERWYRADRDFPDEAFRDAAEWLAAAARPREGPAPAR